MVDGHRIELVRHHAPAALGGLVAGIVGMSERAPGVVRRRQPAGSLVPLVFSFGSRLRVDALAGDGRADREYGSFLAGFSTGPASTSFERSQDCVQVYLTPLGVERILGIPGMQAARSVLDLDDIDPALGGSTSDRLHAATTWRHRFDIVETLLLDRASRTADPPGWLPWMWGQIHASGGQARIADLVSATGWSHRHVTSRFAEHVGVTPKQASSVVRFERASLDLGRLPLAEIAARHGYSDQSHFTRDAGRFAGETPQEHAAAQRPTAVTALGATY
ncbi:AraC-like DNA-binding protein [Mumia flava]|uniref:AraC-like DNA-binding protein n=1 Tax=Mumia flava TaxID=1348852 RepID=A0A2M9BID9_9ACTN|nr:helix-turn-helix transcriptional regulator [Mumia flava]PJJ57703.1 AraC-like DNA-binding protein [Mumia flava]